MISMSFGAQTGNQQTHDICHVLNKICPTWAPVLQLRGSRKETAWGPALVNRSILVDL